MCYIVDAVEMLQIASTGPTTMVVDRGAGTCTIHLPRCGNLRKTCRLVIKSCSGSALAVDCFRECVCDCEDLIAAEEIRDRFFSSPSVASRKLTDKRSFPPSGLQTECYLSLQMW